ncbi:histidine phosphatase family protein [Marinospirillum insulare]|uniref:Alpha-ribazole-5'-phosphate phosphatase n=1 Tax=Marinospirillum insulare TaxID=217169 RepID=A0ABQ5ZW48_9GAMM|nr:histidine phosphatase family protein [Marinospirillum insulare]GLR64405.1 alpha-ribazole-5'-phosphate phosphatase [Marinospirillum insulare]
MLYFIRHAPTHGNLSNTWVGHQNEPIAEAYLKQLDEVATELSLIKFDNIYTSPLLRAHVTAKCISKKQINKPEIIIEPLLKERDFAEFEGVYKTQESRVLLEKSSTVESLENIKKRLLEVVPNLLTNKENNLIVSHSAVFRCLVSELKITTLPYKQSLKNLEYVEIL